MSGRGAGGAAARRVSNVNVDRALSAAPAVLKAASLHEQPRWAQKLLKPGRAAEDNGPAASRCLASLRGRPDLLRLVNLSEGAGMAVDEELLGCYPGARDDVLALVREGAVHHVQRLQVQERRPFQRRLEAAAEAESACEQAFPLGAVLFARFEDEFEAVRVDDDLQEAFHGVKVQAGSLAATPVVADGVAEPKKRARRRASQKVIVHNSHMNDA